MGGTYEVIGWIYPSDEYWESGIKGFDEFTSSWTVMRRMKCECKKKYDAVTVITRKCWEKRRKK